MQQPPRPVALAGLYLLFLSAFTMHGTGKSRKKAEKPRWPLTFSQPFQNSDLLGRFRPRFPRSPRMLKSGPGQDCHSATAPRNSRVPALRYKYAAYARMPSSMECLWGCAKKRRTVKEQDAESRISVEHPVVSDISCVVVVVVVVVVDDGCRGADPCPQPAAPLPSRNRVTPFVLGCCARFFLATKITSCSVCHCWLHLPTLASREVSDKPSRSSPQSGQPRLPIGLGSDNRRSSGSSKYTCSIWRQQSTIGLEMNLLDDCALSCCQER